VEPIDLLTTWHRSDGAVWRRTMDGIVVLPGSGEPIALLGPAAGLWELLAEPLTVEEVVTTLAEHYGVDADQVSPEIRATLDELLLRGALCRR
jgi:hypothetical protein